MKLGIALWTKMQRMLIKSACSWEYHSMKLASSRNIGTKSSGRKIDVIMEVYEGMCTYPSSQTDDPLSVGNTDMYLQLWY